MMVKPAEESVFDSIAELLAEDRRPQWYRLMAHLRNLSPEDEMLHLAEAMGFLALITRDTPGAIAAERQRLEDILRDAGFTPGVLSERARELGAACSEFAAAVQQLTDPGTGATQRIDQALTLMQGELDNASRHVRMLTANLRREVRIAIGTVALVSAMAGLLAGWFVGHHPFPLWIR